MVGPLKGELQSSQVAKCRFVEMKGELRKQKGKLKKSKALSKRDENTHDTGRGHTPPVNRGMTYTIHKNTASFLHKKTEYKTRVARSKLS